MSENRTAAKKSLYSSPFSSGYWRSAAKEFGNLRTITVAALLIALRIVIASFYIPVGENLRIFFSFFVNALGSAIYGPLVALAAGAIADLLGFVIAPSGAFFIGYTITAMAGSFVYALFLYRARISAVRLFLCKLAVDVFANMILNSLWNAVLYGKGYIYYLAKSVVKNVVLIPFEVWLLFLFLQLVLPISAKTGLIPEEQGRIIPFSLKSRSSGFAARLACFAGISLIVIPAGAVAVNAYKPLGLEVSNTVFVLAMCFVAAAGVCLAVFGVAHGEKMTLLRQLSEKLSEPSDDGARGEENGK